MRAATCITRPTRAGCDMRHAIALLSLLLAGSAAGDVILEARDEDIRVELHRDAGPCVGSARWAIFYQGRVRIPGCWILNADSVQIAWLDGDISVIPVRAFREPKGL